MKTYQETVKLGRATYEKEMETVPLELGSGLVQAILGSRFDQ
jgi:hypothetical protein